MSSPGGVQNKNECSFCIFNPSQMMNQALYDKYSFVKNSDYIKSIDEIVQGAKITPETVAFLEWQFQGDDQETLKRYYYDFEFAKRSKRFAQCYQFHKEFPRFCDVDIYKIKRKNCEKMRQYQYKIVKKIMNDPYQSISEHTKTQNSDGHEHTKQTEVQNILQEFKRQESELNQSNVFLEIVSELKQLTKNKGDSSFELDGDFYGSKASGAGLETYLLKISKKRKKFQNSIASTERKHHLFRKNLNPPLKLNKASIQQQETKIIRSVSTNNFLFKFQTNDKDSHMNSMEKTKSTFNGSKTHHWLNRDQRQKSVEKIYGKHPRYSSIQSKRSDEPNPESQSKFKINFRINQIIKKSTIQEGILKSKLNPNKFLIINRQKIHNKELQPVARQREPTEKEKDIINKELPDHKSNKRIGLHSTAQSPQKDDRRQSKQKKKLDIVKVYKKIKGIV